MKWTTRRLLAVVALVVACLSAPGTGTVVGQERSSANNLDWSRAPLTRIHGTWHYVSRSSAVLYWQSDGGARSFVEYGRTVKYGSQTPLSGRASFAHVHRLVGLQTGTTYHYRPVCIAADGTKVSGKDATITPVAIAGAIALPGDMTGPPYILDTPGTTYVLDADITAEHSAIEIRATGVTLDLDGHTITYNTSFEKTDFLRRKVSRARGVLLAEAPNVRLLNGTIRQGSATTTASAVEITGSDNPELAGLTVETIGDATGVDSMWSFAAGRIHHNLCLDRAEGWIGYGSFWNPRSCISVSGPGVKVHNNVVRGTYRLLRVGRTGGMNDVTGTDVFENDLHLDARHYTAVAVTLNVRSGVVRDNRILCAGYPATGILLPDCSARYAQVHSNRIRIRPTLPLEPYGGSAAPWDLAIGIVAGGGAYGLDVHDNTVLVYAGKYGSAGEGHFAGNGLRFVNMMFDNTNSEVRDNRITAISEDGQMAACVVVTGGSQSNTLVFRNNKLVSNRCHIILSDREHTIKGKGELDGGRNARFLGNTLVRLGRLDDFQTVLCGREQIDSSAFFLDTAFSGGAGWDSLGFAGSGGVREVRVGRAARLVVREEGVREERVRALWNAEIELQVADPARRYAVGTTGPDGEIELPVLEYLLTPGGRVPLMGVKFVVRKDGFRSVELPAAELPREVTLERGGDDPLPTIARLREQFPDRAKPEADWDWMRAPLTATRGEDRYVSVTSACVFWQTDGRAWGYVEYGPTTGYGSRTQPHPKPNFAHLHHLRGLNSGKEYHYRTVSVGVAGNRIIGKDRTFRTGSGDGMIRLPGEGQGPPFVISRPGNYLLTEDVTLAAGDALRIQATGVTIDLDGHTITYGTARPPARPARGIVVARKMLTGGPRLLNGIVREGPHDAARSNAIHLQSCNDYEIGWVRVEVQSFLTSAIFAPWASAKADIHHNMLWDRGHAYANRHQGCRTICLSRGGVDARIHHNIIISARNRAIDGGKRNVEVFENTIELLGHSTNSSGISLQGPGHRIHHNLVEARGEHPCAIWGWRDNKIYANKVQAEADMCISYEYGALGGNGFRTNYDVNRYDGMTFFDNLVVVRADPVPCRGYQSSVSWLFWLANIGADNRVSVRDNTLVSMVSGGCTTVGVGLSSNSPNLVFKGNRIISNYQCVSFGTHRGNAENVKWISNTFVKAGDDPRFCTFGSARLGFSGNILTDSRFEGGAKVEFQSESHDRGDLTFRWNVDVETTPGVIVTIKDKNEAVVFSGKADAEGKLRAEVVGQIVRYSGGSRVALEAHTPHTVTVEKDGKSVFRRITVDKSHVLRIRP